MRWKKPNIPRDGDTRVVKRFALFPIEAAGEVRWLEFVTVQQSYYEWLRRPWVNECFFDKKAGGGQA